MSRSFTVPAGVDFKELLYQAGTIMVKRRRKDKRAKKHGKQTVLTLPEDGKWYYDHIFKDHIQKAHFLLDRIIEVGVKQRDEMINGFTQLKLEYLYEIVPKATLDQIISVLEGLGIIEVRKKWRYNPENPEDNHCKGYKLTPEYANRDVVFIEVERKLRRRIETHYSEKTKDLLESVHHPEHRWQNDILKSERYWVDEKTAYALTERFLEEGRALDDDEIFTHDRYKAMKMQIKKLSDGYPDYSVAPQCDKVSTVLTNASKYIRPFLKDSKGRCLMQLDFATSHAMHLIKHLEEEIKRGYLYISNNREGGYPYIGTPNFEELNIDKLASEVSFLKDKALNYKRDLYQYLADRYEEDYGYRLNKNDKSERNEIKNIWMQSFLCGGFPNKKKAKWMKSVFPEISKYIQAFIPRKFSIALQTSESRLLNNIIIRRICQDHPKCLLFGLYDAVLVEEDYADEVYSIMYEESEKYFGFPVVIKPHDYDHDLERYLDYLSGRRSDEFIPVLASSLQQQP